MKLLMSLLPLTFAITAQAANVQVTQDCLDKAGRLALIAAVPPMSLSGGFRSLRLGQFADQGQGADTDSAYEVRGNQILVSISESAAMNAKDGEDQEIHSTSFFEVRVLNAKACKLGPATDVTPE